QRQSGRGQPMDFGDEHGVRRDLPPHSWRGEKTSATLTRTRAVIKNSARPIANPAGIAGAASPQSLRTCRHLPHRTVRLSIEILPVMMVVVVVMVIPVMMMMVMVIPVMVVV